MDFILKRLDSLIATAESRSVEKQTLLRERIEYLLFLLFGCLWNENKYEILPEKRKKILEDLNKISIGHVVSAIRELDIKHMYIKKSKFNVLNDYPELRNSVIGHGYTHGDNAEKLENELENVYEELMQFDFWKRDYDIVVVQSLNNGYYEGISFPIKENGLVRKWVCDEKRMADSNCINKIYLLDNEMNYHCISPFVHIENKGASIYIFQSLEDKLSGNVKMNQLFVSDIKKVKIDELIDESMDSERRRISVNGTIMNYYEKNYSNYIDVPLGNIIKKFLKENRSNIQATIWGHGGVGKTACVQNICHELFNDSKSIFEYIIFVSAKDRQYDMNTGDIVSINNIRKYEEVLNSILQVVYDKATTISDEPEAIKEKENDILKITSKVLIIIDDYETFEDSEKAKIQDFVERLNIDYFKVLITTRNKRYSTGVEIKLDELSETETKNFLLNVFKSEKYKNCYSMFKKDIMNPATLQKIYQATSGRVLFLYQFANIYGQKGLDENLINNLNNSENAKEFLYGRVYEYLGENAKKIFCVLSQISDEKDYIFKEKILNYILSDEHEDILQAGIQELIEQKIIEKYDIENYRIYSQDLYVKMRTAFEALDEAEKNRIKSKIQTIGGTQITGTVYEAMLDEANASRNKGNVENTLQKYKHILNEKNCPKDIKKKALLNITSYCNITLSDIDQAILLFESNMDKLGLLSDVDVLKMYVGYLWSSDDIGKAKACDILERFFAKKTNKKTNRVNFELFTIAVNYCSHNAIENTPDAVKKSAENRILNEYGKELFRFVQKQPFNEHRPAIRHNISLALVSTTKLAADLTRRGYNKKDLIRDIKIYGEKNFIDLFKKQLAKIEINDVSKHVEGDVIQAQITYVAKYGLLVEIPNMGKAIIHNTEIEHKRNFKAGEMVEANIIGQNEKGYILSLKNVNKLNQSKEKKTQEETGEKKITEEQINMLLNKMRKGSF